MFTNLGADLMTVNKGDAKESSSLTEKNEIFWSGGSCQLG